MARSIAESGATASVAQASGRARAKVRTRASNENTCATTPATSATAALVVMARKPHGLAENTPQPHMAPRTPRLRRSAAMIDKRSAPTWTTAATRT